MFTEGLGLGSVGTATLHDFFNIFKGIYIHRCIKWLLISSYIMVSLSFDTKITTNHLHMTSLQFDVTTLARPRLKDILYIVRVLAKNEFLQNNTKNYIFLQYIKFGAYSDALHCKRVQLTNNKYMSVMPFCNWLAVHV